jgi:hypothetical protein
VTSSSRTVPHLNVNRFTPKGPIALGQKDISCDPNDCDVTPVTGPGAMYNLLGRRRVGSDQPKLSTPGVTQIAAKAM